MKIVHVVDSMEVGGAETLVSQMCRLQREQGHEPAVFAIAALGALGERLRADDVLLVGNAGIECAEHPPRRGDRFAGVQPASDPERDVRVDLRLRASAHGTVRTYQGTVAADQDGHQRVERAFAAGKAVRRGRVRRE